MANWNSLRRTYKISIFNFLNVFGQVVSSMHSLSKDYPDSNHDCGIRSLLILQQVNTSKLLYYTITYISALFFFQYVIFLICPLRTAFDSPLVYSYVYISSINSQNYHFYLTVKTDSLFACSTKRQVRHKHLYGTLNSLITSLQNVTFVNRH